METSLLQSNQRLIQLLDFIAAQAKNEKKHAGAGD